MRPYTDDEKAIIASHALSSPSGAEALRRLRAAGLFPDRTDVALRMAISMAYRTQGGDAVPVQDLLQRLLRRSGYTKVVHGVWAALTREHGWEGEGLVLSRMWRTGRGPRVWCDRLRAALDRAGA